MSKIAVLRPEPAASATVERARQAGLDAFCLTLFDIVPVEWDPPDPSGFDAVLLTSANAVRHGGPGLEAFKSLPIYCVGPATAAAAREAGFAVAALGKGGVRPLLMAIGPRRLFHPCGRDRIETVVPGQSVVRATVYDSRAREAPEELNRLEGAIALVHSPRAGERLAELAASGAFDGKKVTIAAISPTAASACGEGWNRRRFAPEPNDSALLALAAELCNSAAGE